MGTSTLQPKSSRLLLSVLLAECMRRIKKDRARDETCLNPSLPFDECVEDCIG